MKRRDNLLERLQQVNPVPDPSRLYEDLDTSHQVYLPHEQRREKTMVDTKIDQLNNGPEGGRVGRGLLIGATAAVVVIVALAFAFVIGDGSNVAGDRVLEVTFDGEQCTYEGPAAMSPGEVEMAFYNLSSERAWMDFARLDDDKTIQDVLDYMPTAAAATARARPVWAEGVWSPSLLAGDSRTGHVAVLEPGLHVLVCGTWTPYVSYFGAGLTVE